MAVPLYAGITVNEYDLTTSVPAPSPAVGAIAGVFNWGPVMELVSIDSQTKLANTFGPPTSNNAETWFTAWSYLAYSNQLYVVRAANTTNSSPNIAYLNALANTAAVANVYLQVVQNPIHFQSRGGNNIPVTTFDANCMFVARYPGARGNSLQVAVCDSVNAYSSNINIVANLDVSACTTIGIGATNATIYSLSVSANVTAANAWATTLFNKITVGDYIVVGNSSTIGTQFLQVNTITNTSTAANAQLTLTFVSPYSLAANFTANATTSNVVSRYWEFYNIVGTPPTQSQWVSQYGAGNSAVVDTQHVVVVDGHGQFSGVPGTILEVYKDLSRAYDAQTPEGGANFYQTVINQNSNYIWAVNDRPDHNANSANSFNVLSSTDSIPVFLQFGSGQDGETENSASLATITSGYNMFNSTYNSTINLVMQGKPIGGTTVATNGQTVNNFQLANYLISNLIAQRKDCVLCVTPDDAIVLGNKGTEAQSLAAWRSIITSTSYAICDSGYHQIYDQYNNVYRYIPTNGDIAGLCAYTDAIRNPWWSPAGYNRGFLRNVVQLRYNPSLTDQGIMYSNSINPVATVPNQGTVLLGDKTMLTQPSAFSRINVRRLFLTLEKAISTAALYTLFEFNDAFTRSAFVNMVTPYLKSVKALRGIYDFYVQCDATNNTPTVIDANQFVCSIYIKPARSISWITLNFVAVPTGISFSSVVGTF